jgi:hypothetical protein
VALRHRRTLQTPAQRRAELAEHFRTLQAALQAFPLELIAKARTILRADALTQSEKFLGAVEWLQARHADRKHRLGHNRLWRAVATAPAGFCTPRASMIGTLLEDLAEGLAFDEVKRRFDAKMHPLRYQRPQAEPTAGNIAEAEKVVAKLGLEPSLRRRWALVSETQRLWAPADEAATTGDTDARGVFAHLKRKDRHAAGVDVELPTRTFTWAKLRDEILPTARRLEVLVPDEAQAFCALTTAVVPDAPPLLQWDAPQRRHPVAWYYYHGKTSAKSWSLVGGAFARVAGLCLKPSAWFSDAFAHHGQALMILIDGAKDTRAASLCLFPSLLRNELHAVRATIEAFSKSRQLEPPEGEGHAAGLMLEKGQNWDVLLRVDDGETVQTYRLDRWD